ncbi:hypothetical protein BDV95DRAFT_533460 [Massariosphaeria phaeospora]|uniref:Rhodopsin domain-containing protein n=1 Tax=Massariosphaeria phaeospora TaxID=100035 RepID=A0A7C8MH69_9PLEO|nr:hypothetical protein BDV95DRAFT_533460 [Massariosphaeria phaeospora]
MTMEPLFTGRDLYHLISRADEKPDLALAGAPPGVTPNFIDPPSRGIEMVSVSITMTLLTLFAIVARVYTKMFITKGFDWGDYFAIGALITAVARTVINCMAVYIWGLGRHVWDVPPSNFASIRNCQFIMDMVYLAGIMFAKFSILILYVKVFHIRRNFRWLCYFMMFITFAYCTAFFFIYAFDCKPVYYNWHFDPLHYDCIDITQIKMAVGAVNILTDLIIVIMPLPLVMQLQLAKAQKIGLLLVFSTGFFILVTTIVREIIVVRTSKEFDQPWTVADEVIWLTVELNVGIVCITMPVLSPIWRKAVASQLGLSYLRNLLSSMRSTRGQSKISESGYSGGLDSAKMGWNSGVSAGHGPNSIHSDQIDLMEIRVKREVSQV